jgi:D-glycero-D-manno-heptose 1,7-bisphosphate phosphatase
LLKASAHWIDDMNFEDGDAAPVGVPAMRPSRRVRPVGQAARSAVFIAQHGSLIEKAAEDVEPTTLRFTLGAVESLAALAAAGHALVLFAAHGGRPGEPLSRAQTARIHGELQRRLLAEAGVEVLDFVACPHPPTADGTPACLCRPPSPGLLLRAARLHNLDLSRSWLVGDTFEDVQAGQRAGCNAVLLDHDNGGVRRRHVPSLRQPFARCTTWDEVVHLILLESRRIATRDKRFGF